jgi:hypothetical protein
MQKIPIFHIIELNAVGYVHVEIRESPMLRNNAKTLAWKAAVVGGLLGPFFVLKDMLPSISKSNFQESALEVLGAAAGCAILCWICGYAYGIARNT